MMWFCPYCNQRRETPGPHRKPGSAVQCLGHATALRGLRRTLKKETPLSADELASIEFRFAVGEELRRREVGRLLAMALNAKDRRK